MLLIRIREEKWPNSSNTSYHHHGPVEDPIHQSSVFGDLLLIEDVGQFLTAGEVGKAKCPMVNLEIRKRKEVPKGACMLSLCQNVIAVDHVANHICYD